MKIRTLSISLAVILLFFSFVPCLSESTPSDLNLQHFLLGCVDIGFPEDWEIYQYYDSYLFLITDPNDLINSTYIEITVSEPLELAFFEKYGDSIIEMNSAQVEKSFVIEKYERFSADAIKGNYYIVTSPELDGISGVGILIHGHYIIKLSLFTYSVDISVDDCLSDLKQISFSDLSLVSIK